MATVLHRTLVHHEALEWVQAKKIEWWPKAGSFGRFAYRNGDVIADPLVLIALYELRNAGLIHVCDKAVAITLAGARSLADWDGVLK